jgi:hypothetical protein
MDKEAPTFPRKAQSTVNTPVVRMTNAAFPRLNTVWGMIAIILGGCLLLQPISAGEMKPKAAGESLDRIDKQAHTFLSHGEYPKAEALFRALVKEATRLYGPEHPKTLTQRYELADAFLVERYYPEAEAEFRAVWELRAHVLGPQHADTLLSRFQLAVTLCSQHKHAEAEAEYRAVLADQEQALGVHQAQTLQTDFRLAQCLEMQGRIADARMFALRACEGAKETLGESSFEYEHYRMLLRQLQN